MVLSPPRLEDLVQQLRRPYDPLERFTQPVEEETPEAPARKPGSLLMGLAEMSAPQSFGGGSGGGFGGGGNGPLMQLLRQAGGSDIEVLHGANVAGHAGHLHLALQQGLVPIGKKLQKLGFDVGEHPAFGGVGGSHTDKSHHYAPGGAAIDVNYHGNGRWQSEAQALAWLKKKLQKAYGSSAYYG